MKYSAILAISMLLITTPAMASSLEQQQQEFLQQTPQQAPEPAYTPPVYTPPGSDNAPVEAYTPPVQAYTPPVYTPPVEAYIPPTSTLHIPSDPVATEVPRPAQPTPDVSVPKSPLVTLTEPEGYQRLKNYPSDSIDSSPTPVAPARQAKFVVRHDVPSLPKPPKALPFTVVALPSSLRLSIPQVQGMLYPLRLPAFITSFFGWRSHPISGAKKFHSGLDLAIEEGSPVVAVYGGKVISAGWMGGYGNAVLIEHSGYRTLYAHLSKILVKPGPLQQGTVIGAVGSTGLSTGPHLHFELQQQTGKEWIPIDPGKQVETALQALLQKNDKNVSVSSISAHSGYNVWEKIDQEKLNRAYPPTRE